MNGTNNQLSTELTMLFSDACKARIGHSETVVILNDQTDNHVAVGDDADKLFELFGWQTATAMVGKGSPPVLICPCGRDQTPNAARVRRPGQRDRHRGGPALHAVGGVPAVAGTAA